MLVNNVFRAKTEEVSCENNLLFSEFIDLM